MGPNVILRSLYLSLLESIESHVLAVQPDEAHPLPEYIRSRNELHAALVDAIDNPRRGAGAGTNRRAQHHHNGARRAGRTVDRVLRHIS